MPRFRRLRVALSDFSSVPTDPQVAAQVEGAFRALPFDLTRINRVLQRKFGADRDTPLNLAIRAGHPRLVKTIMGFDPSVTSGDNRNGYVPINFAQHLASQEDASKANKQVRAIVESRARWQPVDVVGVGVGGRGGAVSVNNFLRLMESASGGLQANLARRPSVSFYGLTQSGKSALFNYMLGAQYRLSDSQLEYVGGGEEVVQVGTGFGSETVFPTVFPLNLDYDGRTEPSWSLVDMPGFDHTGPREETLCIAASTSLLFNDLLSQSPVQAIVFVIRYDDTQSGSAFTLYRKASSELGKILNTDFSPDNFLFAVTKAPPNVSTEDVTRPLSALCDQLDQELAREGPDGEKEDALRITRRLVDDPDRHLVFADAADQTGNSREAIIGKITALIPQDSSQYDFSLGRPGGILSDALCGVLGVVVDDFENLCTQYNQNYDAIAQLKIEISTARNDIEIMDLPSSDEYEAQQANAKVCIDFSKNEIEQLEATIKKNEAKLAGSDPVDASHVFEINQESELPDDALSVLLSRRDENHPSYDHAITVFDGYLQRSGGNRQIAMRNLETEDMRLHCLATQYWRLPDCMHSVEDFKVTAYEDCHEVLVGTITADPNGSGEFRSFKSAPPGNAPFFVSHDDVSGMDDYLVAAREGKLCFKIVGELSCRGLMKCTIAYRAKKSLSDCERSELIQKIANDKFDLQSEKRVRERRDALIDGELSQNMATADQLRTSIQNAEEALNEHQVALERSELELEINEDVYCMVQRLVLACALGYGRFEYFAGLRLHDAPWASEADANRARAWGRFRNGLRFLNNQVRHFSSYSVLHADDQAQDRSSGLQRSMGR